MNLRGMPHLARDWDFVVELGGGNSSNHELPSIMLDNLKLTRRKLMQTNTEIQMEHGLDNSNEAHSTTATRTDVDHPISSATKENLVSTGKQCLGTNDLILGSRSNELIVIILVVVFNLASAILLIKYYQLKDDLKQLKKCMIDSDNTTTNSNNTTTTLPPQGGIEVLIN